MKKRTLLLAALSLVGLSGAAGAATLASNATAMASPALSTVSYKTTTEQPETASTKEADGPGGHQDTGGTNLNHQFNGQE